MRRVQIASDAFCKLQDVDLIAQTLAIGFVHKILRTDTKPLSAAAAAPPTPLRDPKPAAIGDAERHGNPRRLGSIRCV